MNTYITGPTIKSLREAKGITQSDLAEKIGVSSQAISKWETSKGLPDISLIEALSQALGVSVMELMSGETVINKNASSNMLLSKFYVCPVCGNVIHCTGNTVISCCGITLPALEAEEMDEIYYVYVVDDEERLRGVFPLKHMITSPSVSKVKHVMRKDPISVHVDTPVDEVIQTIEKYNLVAVPVVDSIGRLVGRITVDDVMDEVREQAERDYQLASGLSQDVETDDSVFRQTTARLPWLLIGMLGGIGNSMILGNFDSTFAAHPEMALYIPLIGGTGGNVGTQSSALVVQGLANSSLDANNTWKQILKESVVALINATIISMLVYVYNFIRFGATATVSYSVSLSLFAVVMFASIFGTLVPMTLEKMKIDPAIATGPFISITNDIIGMLLYMGITVMLS